MSNENLHKKIGVLEGFKSFSLLEPFRLTEHGHLYGILKTKILSFITIFTLCMWFPHIAIDFVFVLDMVILYFLAISFKWCAIVCKSSSDVAIKTELNGDILGKK